MRWTALLLRVLRRPRRDLVRVGTRRAASMWGYGDKNKIPCCFQMFDCDIERSYVATTPSTATVGTTSSYQYRLKSKDPASARRPEPSRRATTSAPRS